MLFSLWLIALVLAAEARTLTDDAITFEDTTALPALDTSDLPADISNIVDMKAVLLDGDMMLDSEQQEEEEEDGVETATEYLVVDGASIPIEVDTDYDDDDTASTQTTSTTVAALDSGLPPSSPPATTTKAASACSLTSTNIEIGRN